MTTLTQHALATGYTQTYYSCDPPWAYRCNVPSYSGYAYIQPAYAQDCTRYDSYCWGNAYNQQPTYTQVNEINGFDCYGEWRCVSGWNQAIVQAQTDFQAGQGENIACPDGHTDNFCSGWTHGYDTEWNALSQPTPIPSQPTPIPSQPTPTQCGLGQTIGNDGLCHLSITGVIKACSDHPGACGILLHLLGL
jgi:hypothetical protein